MLRPTAPFCAALLAACVAVSQARGEKLPVVTEVAAQPLKAQAKRVAQALKLLGVPLTKQQQAALDKALAETDDAKAVRAVQAVLDPLCLAGVNINAESRVKSQPGPAPKELMEQGWRVFLIKVHNQAGVTAPLVVRSPNAAPLFKRSTGSKDPPPTVKPQDVPNRWLDLANYDHQPLTKTLSGLEVDYRIVSLYSRVRGKREATFSFHVGQGTQDLGFRSESAILFECQGAVKVVLEVLDDDGEPTIGQFIIRDRLARVYPARSRRLAPDFFFHDQIYRRSGEHVMLPPGEYDVTYTRGPEYLAQHRTLTVKPGKEQKETFRLKRWIKLADLGWYSGDHHVHAAGCSHYESPTQGVTPEAMMRHIQGEDLNVGCVLSWGPCWYYQKQFFEGDVHKLSTKNYVMRYDVEVSGFPSSHAGHLCLLRLKEDDYPGTTRVEQWPSWNLPVLQWGKKQGAVVGFSHSGWGLQVDDNKLPSYKMPPFNGIGANEYIVDVTHDACDFISAVDTPIVYELSIWYHTLNCGYTARISGETDFPCIYGERVGLGRSYVKLPKGEPLDFDKWVLGIRDGRSYCSEGKAHLPDFAVNGLGVGEKGDKGRASFLAVKKGEPLKIKAKAAAWLESDPVEYIRRRPLHAKPYWHAERARVGGRRAVSVELIVNGKAVAAKEVAGDGKLRDIEFDFTPEHSSWVALRIFPAAHTNPIFVEVDGKPIRASRRSAKWCLEAVNVCWNSKKGRIRPAERKAAAAAYEHARQAYRKILAESVAD